MAKSEITVGLRLHIAPMQYNFLESWGEKKVYIEDNMSEEDSLKELKQAREQILDICINDSLSCLEKANIPFNQAHLLSNINKQLSNENQQEIKIDLTPEDVKPPTVQPIVKEEKNNNIPKMVIPSFLQPNSPNINKEVPPMESKMFSGLASSVLSNNAEYDSSNDLQTGIIEGDFLTK